MTEPLDLIVPFVNTLDLETGADSIASPESLAAWLREQGALDRAARVARADVRRAQAFREALRASMAANDGAPLAPEAIDALDRQARRSRVALSFAGGRAGLEPAASGVDGVLGRLLAAVALAMADGTWSRYKACRADDCRWAFVDGSRNGSRHWCAMRRLREPREGARLSGALCRGG